MQDTQICEVKVGLYTHTDAILRDMENAGLEWCDWGRDILSKVRLDDSRRTIPLFLCTNESLGLHEGADYRNIIHPERTTLQMALNAGYKICPGEIAPALLLQHPHMSEELVGEGLAVGMDVLAANCSWLSILALRKKRHDESKPILSATRAIWNSATCRFIFTR